MQGANASVAGLPYAAVLLVDPARQPRSGPQRADNVTQRVTQRVTPASAAARLPRRRQERLALSAFAPLDGRAPTPRRVCNPLALALALALARERASGSDAATATDAFCPHARRRSSRESPLRASQRRQPATPPHPPPEQLLRLASPDASEGPLRGQGAGHTVRGVCSLCSSALSCCPLRRSDRLRS